MSNLSNIAGPMGERRYNANAGDFIEPVYRSDRPRSNDLNRSEIDAELRRMAKTIDEIKRENDGLSRRLANIEIRLYQMK